MMSPKVRFALGGLYFLLAFFPLVTIDVASEVAQLTSSTYKTSTPNDSFVTRVYFNERSELDWLASWLDIWEVDHVQDYLITVLDQGTYSDLAKQGYSLQIENSLTNRISIPQSRVPNQVSGISGFPCYRTVEETYADLTRLADQYTYLASLTDIGDSWEKVNSGGQLGYDLYVLVISVRDQMYYENKPKLFLVAATHAREYSTAEMALRFAEHLLNHYSLDPEITWLLDHFEVHVMPLANPDGRKLAEMGYYQRKNTNRSNGGNCAQPPTAFNQYGTDLNRNHSYQWGGASSDPCSTIYQGPFPASEPETRALEAYLKTIFPDQRDVGEERPAPTSTSGVFISLHSYGELVLWPWGYTEVAPPNATELAQLGKRLASLNGYFPTQSYNLYRTTGDSDDFVYGELGVPAYTFEMGTSFFQDCRTFENEIYPDNLQALLYALKVAWRPYLLPFGPEIAEIQVEPEKNSASNMIALSAKAISTDTEQKIVGGRVSINLPSWLAQTTYAMQPKDGLWDDTQEELYLTLETTDWEPGRYILFIESENSAGHWGPPSAIFVWIASDDLHYYLPLVRKP